MGQPVRQGSRLLLATLVLQIAAHQAGVAAGEKGPMALTHPDDAQWHFEGELGRRIDANVSNWLLRAPDANPGLLDMFQRRDRHLPYKTPVPWAGEFAGKYLISAVQACRMSADARLKPHVQAVVDALVASQAEDGYLGPWPKAERLLGHWDLWGHYHCILGLLAWHDFAADQQAFDCAVRAADAICNIYLDGDRRPIDAGTPQINLAILHALGDLYRRTGTARYRNLMERIEQDLQRDGDWLRLGADSVPYYKLPGGGTRWESLHIVQGLVELYRITGKENYKKAVLSLWRSIRQYDRHPSGAFSTRERAFGSVYEPGAIETCCSVAWEALSIDVLKITGDPQVADELELTTWNQVLASQHPSGNWSTYDTPLDGIRAPSFQQISFQYRPGTPELNCCSVNAPRGLGMLSEWAVLQDDQGLVLNFYGPSRFDLQLTDGTAVQLRQSGDYPVRAHIMLTVSPAVETAFSLKLRIPAWSRSTRVSVNGTALDPAPAPGTYFEIARPWQAGDVVKLSFDLTPRFWHGQEGRYGHAAVYVGTLLLALDAYYNDIETADLPPLDLGKLKLEPVTVDRSRRPGYYPPLGLWRVRTPDGKQVVLCDFASAGAHGTDYMAWIPVADPPPPAVRLEVPANDARGGPGPVLFRWSVSPDDKAQFEVQVARDTGFVDIVARIPARDARHALLQKTLAAGTYYWKVRARNQRGESDSRDGVRSFHLDDKSKRSLHAVRADGLMAASDLDGEGDPQFGTCLHQQHLQPASDRNGNEKGAVAFNGRDSELRYILSYFPEDDYTFLTWICPEDLAAGRMQQVFSAWCSGMDDPLRVTLRGKYLTAGIESGTAYTTPGVPLEEGAWAHVAAVKQGPTLTLYVNGRAAQSVGVPERLRTHSEQIGIGYNPLFSGGEHYCGKIDQFAFFARAFSADEVKERASAGAH